MNSGAFGRAPRGLTVAGLVLMTAAARAALPIQEWQYSQELRVSQPGLVRVLLPPATLGAAQPGLDDLRLLSPQGVEIPWLAEETRQPPPRTQGARSFDVRLTPPTTVIRVETGVQETVEAVTLSTPARRFIKAVEVAVSNDAHDWQTVVRGAPVFRQEGGPSQLRVSLPPGAWGFLRLTVDDRRSEPIPFSGVDLHLRAAETAAEPVDLPIVQRTDRHRTSRLVVALPAANLRLARVELLVPDPVFTRDVTVAVARIVERSASEAVLAQGPIFRLALEGQAVASNLTLQVEARIPNREIILTIANGDSPPLTLAGVRGWFRPVSLVFQAPAPGAYRLLTGKPGCGAPDYDLAPLASRLLEASAARVTAGPLLANPGFVRPEVLPGLPEAGMPLDAAAWKYRKPVLVREPGVQGLDLGLDVLAHSQPGLPDLRLLRAGLQVPFILEQTSELIVLNPRLESAPDAKRPSLSRWALRLPYPCLPVTSLSCRSSARLFQRDVLLYEYLRDAYGTATRRVLAQGHWRRTPEDAPGILTLSLAAAPQSDHLILETDNGDNPPLHLDRFEFVYPLSRLCFKTSAASALQLYYGNPAAASPRYDLSLVAPQLLAAPRKAALLGREELLKGSAWPRTFEAGGAARLLFWAVLALVVAGLVFVILRVLPRRPES